MIEDLIQRIQEEMDQIQRAKRLAEKRWKKALTDSDYLGSVALDLLNFYQGIERTFEVIAKGIDGKIPKAWKGFQLDLTDFINQFLKSHSAGKPPH